MPRRRAEAIEGPGLGPLDRPKLSQSRTGLLLAKSSPPIGQQQQAQGPGQGWFVRRFRLAGKVVIKQRLAGGLPPARSAAGRPVLAGAGCPRQDGVALASGTSGPSPVHRLMSPFQRNALVAGIGFADQAS